MLPIFYGIGAVFFLVCIFAVTVTGLWLLEYRRKAMMWYPKDVRRYRGLRWWQRLTSEDMAEYRYHDLMHCRGWCNRHKNQPPRSIK